MVGRNLAQLLKAIHRGQAVQIEDTESVWGVYMRSLPRSQRRDIWSYYYFSCYSPSPLLLTICSDIPIVAATSKSFNLLNQLDNLLRQS
jgi:hypothetical protein